MNTSSSRPILRPTPDSLSQLIALFGSQIPQCPRLHLGCGEVHLPGYINIDFPPDSHTVQTSQGADLFADITRLSFPEQSIGEIRLHHVFEHFDRATALALLSAWALWLVPGGLLTIETPDLNGCISLLADPNLSMQEKQVVIRHLFGSQEASWAVHYDGWYADKYLWVLPELGFSIATVEHSSWKLTKNVTVQARRNPSIEREKVKAAALSILRCYTVDNSASEERLYGQWVNRFNEVLDHCYPINCSVNSITNAV